MLRSMEILDSATFVGQHPINGLQRINFFFGSNGAGKSTISKAIATGELSGCCNLQWEADLPLERMVYSKFHRCEFLGG